MEIITQIYDNYSNFKSLFDSNILFFSFVFLVFSLLWLTFVGVVSPILFLSILFYDYVGCIIYMFLFLTASVLNFFFSFKSRTFIYKFLKREVKIENEPFYLYLVFRLIPGIPYLIKNLSVSFFNLSFKKFILAIIIADTPQIILFTFFFKKIISTSENIIIFENYNDVISELFLPTMLLVVFFIFIYLVKLKFKFKFLK